MDKEELRKRLAIALNTSPGQASESMELLRVNIIPKPDFGAIANQLLQSVTNANPKDRG